MKERAAGDFCATEVKKSSMPKILKKKDSWYMFFSETLLFLGASALTLRRLMSFAYAVLSVSLASSEAVLTMTVATLCPSSFLDSGIETFCSSRYH